MSNFKKWVQENGGPTKVSKRLKVTPDAVTRWSRGESPNKSNAGKILAMAKGRLTAADLYPMLFK
jgi:hypothetical protein